MYLNGAPPTSPSDGLEGGATRIFSKIDAYAIEDDDPPRGPCVDIPPRRGRVLVFEQDGILHSGEPVQNGVKISVRTDFMYELLPVNENNGKGDEGMEVDK